MNTPYMNELIECNNCNKEVKRCDMKWNKGGGSYTDICSSCSGDKSDNDCYNCDTCGENCLVDKMEKVENDEGDDILVCRCCMEERINEEQVLCSVCTEEDVWSNFCYINNKCSDCVKRSPKSTQNRDKINENDCRCPFCNSFGMLCDKCELKHSKYKKVGDPCGGFCWGKLYIVKK